MAEIIFQNVCKVYPGNVNAVHNFDLKIRDKEFIVLVGPSGCGKSTTLRMLAGLEEITSGCLYIGDQQVNDKRPKDRNIAMVFQSYALYPHMSIYENMAFSLRMRHIKRSEIDKKIREVAHILEIEDLLGRKPKALSGGQRQRVALGRAMVRDPAVFLLDEPLSNLDAKLRTTMRTEITKLHRKLGTTFVYVTHDQTEAMTMADRIVVMKDGIIQQFDTPKNLYDFPCNQFVAGFIGSPQMNFIDTIICRTARGFACLLDKYLIPLPPQQFSSLDAYVDKTVILGIRPEKFQVVKGTVNSVSHIIIEAGLELSELMGAETLLYCTIGGCQKYIVVLSLLYPPRGDIIRRFFYG